MVEHLKQLLTYQLALMWAAVQVLDESRSRVAALADRLDSALTISERESCEALTSRFARRWLCASRGADFPLRETQ